MIPTFKQAQEFFGIDDKTWNDLALGEKQSFVNEILETPKFMLIFKRDFCEAL